ncbi:MAG: hypothetical protein ACLP7P_18120 [Rhodomicrobium sp.]
MRRAITNTLIVWLRLALISALTVASTRWTLSALGAAEFGIYLVSAGIGLTLGFLTGAMTTVSQRALSMVADDHKAIKTAMAECVKNHIVVSCVLVFLGLCLGHFAIVSLLDIPAERIPTALYILYFAVFAGAIGVVSAAFEAFLWSREDFVLFSVLGVVHAAFTFLIALALPHLSGDRLFFYAASTAASSSALSAVGISIVMLRHPDARVSPGLIARSKIRLENRRIFFWNALGSLSYLGQQQGLIYLLFGFFGPTAATSLAVANQVTSLFRQIGQAVNGALAPALYRKEAAGARDEMIERALVGSKYVFLLVCIGLIPVLAEMPLLLRIWLINPPEGSVLLARALLVSLALELLSTQSLTAWQAIGRLSRLFNVSLAITAVSLLICSVCAISGGSLAIIAFVVVATGAANAVTRVLLLEAYAAGIIKRWMLLTVLPSAVTILPSILVLLILRSSFSDENMRAGAGLISCIIVGCGCSLFAAQNDGLLRFGNLGGGKPMVIAKSLWFRVVNVLRNSIDAIHVWVTPVTDDMIADRWERAENLLAEWDSRTRIIADLIPDGADVIEFGAGRMVLKDMLGEGTRYQPSDIVARSEETLVCDLNRETIMLPKKYSHAVFSGVLEYVRSIPQLLSSISSKVEWVIASYSAVDRLPDIVQRKKNGWVSHLSEAELLAAFAENGFQLKDVRTWREQNIYVLQRAASGSQSTGVCGLS